MAATLHNETIYISEVETKENKERRENMDERQKEMCYWGYNFESYVTSPVDKSRLNNDATREGSRPCNDSEAYITVIRTRLGSHSVVFGAEVDCCAKVCQSVEKLCTVRGWEAGWGLGSRSSGPGLIGDIVLCS